MSATKMRELLKKAEKELADEGHAIALPSCALRLALLEVFEARGTFSDEQADLCAARAIVCLKAYIEATR